MNLRDLRYLVAVAEQRHFGRAAEMCFVSQPTLSTQLKKLEATLGVKLIERTNRQVMLTDAGEQIVAQAQRVLLEVNTLTAMAEQHADPLGGDFKLGVIQTLAPYLLPRILNPISTALPNLKLQLTEAQTGALTSMLKQGDLDAVLLALPFNEENLQEYQLFVEPFFFAIPSDHEKAGRKYISVSELEGEEILLLEDGHCLREQALDVCQSHRATENANFRATSIETLRQMVSAGVGTTLVPKLAVPDAVGQKQANVHYLQFRGDIPHRNVGLCWRNSSTRTALLEALAKTLAQALTKV
ncbi:MAG: LysR family transcriptional regulator [Pseudomonadales bacterium]|nr:LysR family transcriptional regulator [Pseudomonadales bacterium]